MSRDGDAEVQRQVVPGRVIDRLIRDMVAELAPGAGVAALPVVRRPQPNGACNWEVPGWIGETDAVERCKARLAGYFALLESQLDLPADP